MSFSIRSFQRFPRTQVASRPSISARIAVRSMHQSAIHQMPRKNSQDKDSIDTEATEYTRSGTDDQVARSAEAYDPSKTKPDDEKAAGGSELDVSPANQEVSKQRPKTEGGAENSPKSGPSDSGHGSPEKGKKI